MPLSGLSSGSGRGVAVKYCRLHQNDADFLAFHVEHVIPKQHGGGNDLDNLCLACAECNWAKGPNLAGLLGGKLYPLFNPRTQLWNRHFRWEQTTLIGKTCSGKVTIHVLHINEPVRILVRENLLFEARFPP